MSDFLDQTESKNGKHNDNSDLLDNRSVILEFALFDKNIEKKIVLPGLGLTVLFGIFLMLMETLGNYLLLCMVWYEKFGMDSKKRTITNQLLSRMILALIFYNIFFMPLFFGAFLTPYSKYIQVLYD